jgi:hypothetical protein
LAGSTAALDRAPARALAFVRAVPVWAWLSAIVAVSALVRFAFAQRIAAPWIVVDELIYSELARSVADDGRLLIRGEPSYGYGVVYPLLISPAYALFDSLPAAYVQSMRCSVRSPRFPRTSSPAACFRAASHCSRRCSPSRCRRSSMRAK